MKFFLSVSIVVAVVGFFVLAADRDPSRDSNSSNNISSNSSDNDCEPVQEHDFELLRNPWVFDFTLVSDQNILIQGLPAELNNIIMALLENECGNLALTCKFFYAYTRPIRYRRMRRIARNSGGVDNLKLYRPRLTPVDMQVPAKVFFYLTILAKDNFEKWVPCLLQYIHSDMDIVFGVLRNYKKYSGMVTPELLGMLRKGLVEKESTLYYLCLECGKTDSKFTFDDLKKLIKENPMWDNPAPKKRVIIELITTRNDLQDVKKFLVQCICPSLWEVIRDVQFENAPIQEIVSWCNSLNDARKSIKDFKEIFITFLPKDLMLANEFSRLVGWEHLERAPLILTQDDFAHLLNADFCKRHHFSAVECSVLLPVNEADFILLMKTLVKHCNLRTEWAMTVLKLYATRLPIEMQRNYLEFLMVTGRPLEEFTGCDLLDAVFVARLAAGIHPLCKYMTAEQIKIVVEKTFDYLLPHVGDLKAIYRNLPIDERIKLMRYMSPKRRL